MIQQQSWSRCDVSEIPFFTFRCLGKVNTQAPFFGDLWHFSKRLTDWEAGPEISNEPFFSCQSYALPFLQRKMLFVVGRAEGCYGHSVSTEGIFSIKLDGKRCSCHFNHFQC